VRVWECAYKSTSDLGELVVNTLHVRVIESPDDNFDAGANAVAAAVDAWLQEDYLACLDTAYHTDTLTVRTVDAGTPLLADLAVDEDGTLADLGGKLPGGVAAVLSFKTLLPTRRGRGRMFLPSPTSSGHLDTDNAWLTSGTSIGAKAIALGATILEGTSFTEGAVDYDVVPVVWSRVGASAEDITSVVFRTRPHWLRSRMNQR
jgi:hypothetical protein